MESIPETHVDLLARPHRERLDAAYIGPDHHTDPSQDGGPRVVVTLQPVRVHAYG